MSMKCIVCRKKEAQRRKMCGACYAKWYRKIYPERVKAYNERMREEQRIKRRQYYLKNREKLLKNRSELWTKEYHNNPEFKKKCQFRYKTVSLVSLKNKVCSKCGLKEDLHRHHLNYDDIKAFIILCRKCHNKVHQEMKKLILSSQKR